ncbi:MAG TPA: Rid family detoxifying hydrolase [Pilimelia sp.]|nr:Rid family detoxifying hydrolase [Pilimelia sp.]
MRPIRTDSAPIPAGAYSQGIAAGGLVFTAGQGPIDPATGEVVGEDVATQTRRTLDNVAAILAAEGLGLEHVVKTTVHLQELRRDFAAYDAVYREYFSEPYPVRTTVGSDLMDILVEIDVVARRP